MFLTFFQLWGSLNFFKLLHKLFYMGKKVYKYDKVLCKNFGKAIAAKRREAEITQEELAFRANFSRLYECD